MSYLASAPYSCYLKDVAGNPKKFSNGGSIFDCAPGTVFNLPSCGCVTAETRKYIDTSKHCTKNINCEDAKCLH